MAMVALIMRPWIAIMRTVVDVRCFILADDVLILALGENMLGQFAKALNSTHDFLQQMGAKVAPNKSYNLASGRKAATWLRQTTWDHHSGHAQAAHKTRHEPQLTPPRCTTSQAPTK